MFQIFKKKLLFIDAVDQFVEDKIVGEKVYSEKTITNYKQKARLLRHMYMNNKNIHLAEMKYRDLESIKKNLQEQNSAQSINLNYLPLIRSTFDYFKKCEVIKTVPEIENVRNYEPRKLVTYLTTEEYFDLQNKLESIDKSLRQSKALWEVKILIHTGLRPRELKKLKWSDLHLSPYHKIKKISVPHTSYNKLGRKIPLSRNAFDIFMAMPRFDKHFVSPYHNEKPDAFRHDLRNIVEKFNLTYKVTPTIFRRTFATWLASVGGVTVQALKSYMGHEHIKTTMAYINEEAVIKSCEYIGDLDIDFLNRKVA